MLLTILLVIQILISIALIAVVLMQRSEGGALGMGGGPTGLMTARGAGNLLTTLTWWLGAMFAICAILLTIVGNIEGRTGSSFDADEIGTALGVPADPTGQTPAAQPTEPVAPTDDGLSLDNLPVGQGTTPSETPAQ
ncbi:MAG TPA: preprotein translocase subunit SecG [Brevundimonas sp.]|jgi:preprotein translocase subunit SecG|uniref:preprotein translocase subunit SecG n=1 Tax=Brevundimonas sp. TaxID=1871086 RepID=UPI002B80BCA4|nr:preprotein translocase subunit SecG [Brevundimonas sp.]HRH20017.1 preprotein translocase subunit SecG [Brevundimonas sp.]